jgi:hypothetical protein
MAVNQGSSFFLRRKIRTLLRGKCASGSIAEPGPKRGAKDLEGQALAMQIMQKQTHCQVIAAGSRNVKTNPLTGYFPSLPGCQKT